MGCASVWLCVHGRRVDAFCYLYLCVAVWNWNETRAKNWWLLNVDAEQREKKKRGENKTHASISRRGKIMIKKNGSRERWNNILKQWMASARISFETIVVKCWNNVLLLISFSFRSNGNEHKIIDGHYTINKKRKRRISSCSQSFTFKKP